MLQVDLNFLEDKWQKIENIDALVTTAAKTAFEHADMAELSAPGLGEPGSGGYEVSVALSNNVHVQELNHQFRGKNQPTNVLSFPLEEDNDIPPHMREGVDEPALPLGDIVLAFETLVEEAKQQNKPVDHHIAHLVVHGILHLCGYDHIDKLEAVEMEGLECKILALLDIPSPYTDI